MRMSCGKIAKVLPRSLRCIYFIVLFRAVESVHVHNLYNCIYLAGRVFQYRRNTYAI